jgi:hypothetical protein
MIRSALMLAASVFVAASPVAAREPDRAKAEAIFAEARAMCARDGGALWGRSLCGPIFLVDYRDNRVIANQADAEGRLTPDGDVFVGVLPPEVIVANTPTEWAGIRWTQLVSEFPSDADGLSVLLAHEMFHRIQPELGLTRRAEGGNRHLDSLEGRYLLQLEWRALAAALQAPDEVGKRIAVADVLAFRSERYRLFPNAAAEEMALEVNEGVPEYTGVRLGLTTPEARTAFAVRDLSAFVDAPTFVRSFAYATGPAYGLLLDAVDPRWVGRAGDGTRFDERLARAYDITPTFSDLPTRAARYDAGPLRAAEEARESARQARLAAYRARLIDGAVVVLPLDRSNFQFNPQTLTPLEGVGMIYPTLRLTDRWGSLRVETGGALVFDQPRQATVSAVGSSGASGDGWTLELAPGWALQPGDRAGDLKVVCAGTCAD